VDDDLDRKNVILVKMASTAENELAALGDIDSLPAVVFFEGGQPTLFEGETFEPKIRQQMSDLHCFIGWGDDSQLSFR